MGNSKEKKDLTAKEFLASLSGKEKANIKAFLKNPPSECCQAVDFGHEIREWIRSKVSFGKPPL
jgi:hypothetical protein